MGCRFLSKLFIYFEVLVINVLILIDINSLFKLILCYLKRRYLVFRVRKGFLLFFLFIVVISCDLESTESIDKSKHFGKMKSVKRVETIDKVKHFARVGRFDNVEHFDKVKQDIESSVSSVKLSANGKVDGLD